MSRTIINVGAVIDASNQINSAKSSVSSAKSSFTQTKNNVDGKIQNRSNIRNRLSTVQTQLNSIDSQIGKIRSTVESGANLYRSTDNRVESWGDEIKNNVGMRTDRQIQNKWASYFSDDKLKLLRDFVLANYSNNSKHAEFTVEQILDIVAKMVEKVTEFLNKAKPYVSLFKGQARDDSPITDDFVSRATDAEYANLCQLWYDALNEKEKDPEIAFLELIEQNFLEDHPLRKATSEQAVAINYAGLDAMVIGDGNTAIVVFAGTDTSSIEDLLADVAIVAGSASLQEGLAVILVDALSKQYSNIVVTGHSLGGYLATAATLKNDSVSKCVAFDPPGRYDAWLQSVFNADNVAKITTYEAKGSPISDGLKWTSLGINQNVGKVINIEVESKDNFLNHGIKQMHDSITLGDENIPDVQGGGGGSW